MALTSAPVCIVEIGFASSALTPLASVTWVDVTQYVLGFDTKIGRQHELNRVEAGTATVRLDNKDRRFDPANTSSPYSPNVLPNKRLRIRATWNSITYAVFCGFIESWPLKWPSVEDAYVDLKVVDAFKAMNLKNLLPPYAVETLKDNPLVYYRMEESDPSIPATDSSVNNYLGTYSTGTSLGTAGGFAGSNAATFDGISGRLTGTVGSGIVTGTGDFSVAFWIKTAVGGGDAVSQASPAYTDTYLGSYSEYGWDFYPASPNIFWVLVDRGGTSVGTAGVTSVIDGNWHYVVGTRAGNTTKLYVDGVLDATRTAGITMSIPTFPQVIRAGGAGTGTFLTGSVDEVAVFSTALSAARIAAQYAARTSWANQTTGARVTQVLGLLGWPVADQSIETGLSTMQGLPTPQTVLQESQDAATAENGLLFQDDAGLITFFQRSHLVTTAASTTSQATFGDAGGAELPYVLDGIDPVMDDLDLWNDIQCQRSGGPVIQTQDTTSQTTYGVRSLVQSGLKTTDDGDTTDRATWLLQRYKAPVLRVRSFKVTAWSDTANIFPQVLGRNIWDRITLKRTPPGSGPRFVQDSIIEGVEHHYTKAEWVTTYHLSPADPTSYMILDSATKGLLDTGALFY